MSFSFNKSHLCASTMVVHMISQHISGIRMPFSFNKLQICPSTLVVHMVYNPYASEGHFHSTNHKFVLQPWWFIWFHNAFQTSNATFIQQIINLCFNLSGSYSCTTHFSNPMPLSFNKLQIYASTLVVHMVAQRISGIQCHFHSTNYKFMLQP
jgi:hypothetical protein